MTSHLIKLHLQATCWIQRTILRLTWLMQSVYVTEEWWEDANMSTPDSWEAKVYFAHTVSSGGLPEHKQLGCTMLNTVVQQTKDSSGHQYGKCYNCQVFIAASGNQKKKKKAQNSFKQTISMGFHRWLLQSQSFLQSSLEASTYGFWRWYKLPLRKWLRFVVPLPTKAFGQHKMLLFAFPMMAFVSLVKGQWSLMGI